MEINQISFKDFEINITEISSIESFLPVCMSDEWKPKKNFEYKESLFGSFFKFSEISFYSSSFKCVPIRHPLCGFGYQLVLELALVLVLMVEVRNF